MRNTRFIGVEDFLFLLRKDKVVDKFLLQWNVLRRIYCNC